MTPIFVCRHAIAYPTYQPAKIQVAFVYPMPVFP